MAEPEHSKIIAEAAKAALATLGFRRSGRSRLWLADHGYWLGVVEFQPSGFSKGSYLNISAHWLWRPPPYHLSFDYILPDQSRPFIAFVDTIEFKTGAGQQAEQAARDSERLAQQFCNIRAIATVLVAQYQADRPAGWQVVDAAVAAGLVGDMALAEKLLCAVSDSFGRQLPSVRDWLMQVVEALKAGGLRTYVRRVVGEARDALSLPPWLGDF